MPEQLPATRYVPQEGKPMTDPQARIVAVIRASSAALTQAQIASAVDADATEVAKDCYALGAAGLIDYRGGVYSLVKRRAGR